MKYVEEKFIPTDELRFDKFMEVVKKDFESIVRIGDGVIRGGLFIDHIKVSAILPPTIMKLYNMAYQNSKYEEVLEILYEYKPLIDFYAL